MPAPATAQPHRRALLRDDVYRSLRNAIVDGTFTPGEKLVDTELERWLGVSRTPIREAVLRLARSGLVIAKPGRSTVVAPLDTRATLQAQAVAAAMHELAVREAAPHLTNADLDRMRAANRDFEAALQRDDTDAALEADDAFHAVAVDVAGNPFVRDALEAVTPLLRRVESLRFSSVAARGSIAQHDALVDRCAEGDVDAAAALVRGNWTTLADLVVAHLDED
jgi:DNA-binding GntR family transcriptional regulator